MTEILGPLAYRDKKGCKSVICTQRAWPPDSNESCYGWHCSYCDEPCSCQGHFNCEVGKTILDEAKKVADERR